jgi:hypothetical protein
VYHEELPFYLDKIADNVALHVGGTRFEITIQMRATAEEMRCAVRNRCFSRGVGE